MEEQENRADVEIYGEGYILKGKESVEYLIKVAQYVNKMMLSIAARKDKLPLHKSAILTAVNITDELFKLQEKYKKLEEEYQLLIDEMTEPELNKHKKKAGR